jgi:thiazole synthase
VTEANDTLVIAGRTFRSRLIVGTSRYPDPQTMLDAIEASGAEMVTVAVRRMSLTDGSKENLLSMLRGRWSVLPNTAGCFTAKDAVLTAQLAREALEQLLADGFVVLPYCNDDPITCRKLADMGCAAVMPLGAPIGSGMGIRNPYNLRIIREQCSIPLIVDAGVGTASDVAVAMELGIDGVLLNTAIAQAEYPVRMANAMRLAAEAGRLAYRAGRVPRRLYAKASSPLDGIIGRDE